MPTQRRPDELVGILEGDLQPRYEPNFAWKSAVASCLALPGLRGFWPMSAVGVSGQAIDLQGLGNHLTLNGNPQFSYENLIPYCQYDGTGDYHDITDAASGNAFDILGTEVFVETAERGLTIATWVYPEETGTLETFMGKWGAAGARAFRLYLDAADQFNFEISDDGTNSDVAISVAVTMNAWYRVVGRFRPGTFVDIFVNGVEVNQATARAAIFNTATNFEVGARAGGTEPFQGRISLAPISVMQLSTSIITADYQQQRAMFNV